MSYDLIKRFIDIVGSLTVLFVFAPLLILLIFYMSILDRPVFFKQKRVGQYGRNFHLVKFRSMVIKKQQTEGEVFLNSPDVTTLGRVLRRLKIDELPQLFNVLKGEMSLIGPRPLLINPSGFYEEYNVERDSVKPGLTGLAQVNGNIFLTKDERFKLDSSYIKNASFKLDAYIVLKTFLVVLFGEKKFI